MPSSFLLSIACAALLAAQCSSASSHNPHEVYVEAGLLGSKGIGYAHSFSDVLGVRVDVSASDASRSGRAGQFHYDADLKGRQMGAYADWFPFGGKFHLSAGLHARKLSMDVDGRANAAKKIVIGRAELEYGGPKDSVIAHVKWPTVAPYLGLGWGHSTIQRGGISFVSDLGVSFGSPKVELTISDALRKKLDTATVADRRLNGSDMTTDGELERQHRALNKDVGKIKAFPHLFVGVAYRF